MGKTALGELYRALLKEHGPQGWWPLLGVRGTNPTKTGSLRGYHPGDFTYPRNAGQRFEICVGAILTQNTAWPNVEKALLRLKAVKALSAAALLGLPEKELAAHIRPAGYFNQKAKKLKVFAHFFQGLRGRTPTRDELLSLWGIGPETADSILLYAYRVPTFVVDAYTRRVLLSAGMTRETCYDALKALFERSLPRDAALYQEFHALLVEHGKGSEDYGRSRR